MGIPELSPLFCWSICYVFSITVFIMFALCLNIREGRNPSSLSFLKVDLAVLLYLSVFLCSALP